MSKRTEPVLDPSTSATLRAERAMPPSGSAPIKRTGFLRWMLWISLVGISLVLLPVVALRWIPPFTSAFMLQSEVSPVRYEWVPAERIADVARRAVVAAEDQKFWTHNGFDIEAMEKAYEHNQKAKRHKRGASSISQQTAKNLFLWSGGGYFRKGIEAGYTVLIENLWSKDRILEVYLNIIEFGPGIYGVEAASQFYFDKSAGQLTASEAARLAAVLPSPRRWSVRAPGPYVQKRSNWILGQMGYGRRDTPSEEPEMPPGLDPGNASDAAPATDVEAPAQPVAETSSAVMAEPARPAAIAAPTEPVPAEPRP